MLTWLQNLLKPLIDEAVAAAIKDANLALQSDVQDVAKTVEDRFTEFENNAAKIAGPIGDAVLAWMKQEVQSIPILGQIFGPH